MEKKITRAGADISFSEFQYIIESTQGLCLAGKYCKYDDLTGKPLHCDGGDIVFTLGENDCVGYIEYLGGWLYLYNVPECIAKILCNKLDAVIGDIYYY